MLEPAAGPTRKSGSWRGAQVSAMTCADSTERGGFICHLAAGYITGCDVLIDGGSLAGLR